MTTASVDYHFSQKEDLGIALIECYATPSLEALTEETKGCAKSDERVKAMIELHDGAFVEVRAYAFALYYRRGRRRASLKR